MLGSRCHLVLSPGLLVCSSHALISFGNWQPFDFWLNTPLLQVVASVSAQFGEAEYSTYSLASSCAKAHRNGAKKKDSPCQLQAAFCSVYKSTPNGEVKCLANILAMVSVLSLCQTQSKPGTSNIHVQKIAECHTLDENLEILFLLSRLRLCLEHRHRQKLWRKLFFVLQVRGNKKLCGVSQLFWVFFWRGGEKKVHKTLMALKQELKVSFVCHQQNTLTFMQVLHKKQNKTSSLVVDFLSQCMAAGSFPKRRPTRGIRIQPIKRTS